MLLAIDAGNTNTVFAIFDGNGEVCGEWRISSKEHQTADEYAVKLKQLMELKKLKLSDISDVVIASVVPQNVFSLKTFARNYLKAEPLMVSDENVSKLISVKVDRPQEVGADRLVNAIAAHILYKKSAIIVDFGTATTFDIVSKEGEYLGGLIAPGINLSMDALHRATAKLHEVAIVKPKTVIGTTTTHAIQSGVFYGYLGLIEGIIERVKAEFGKSMVVIATGGLAPLYAGATKKIDILNSELTIRGLYLLAKNNKNKKVRPKK